MVESETPKRFHSYSMNRFDLSFGNEFMECRVFWARVVSSETESLFTQYTKHTFYEVQYALEGRIGMVLDEDRRAELAESDFIIIPPDTYHQIVDADSVGARFIMAFSVECKDGRFREWMRYLDEPKPCRETPYMRSLLSAALEKAETDGPLAQQMVASLLENFFLEMVQAIVPKESLGELRDGKREDIDGRAEAICAFIRDARGIGIGVADVARQFNVSERHLNRIVLAAKGKTPKELICHEKLKRIEEYMVSTRLSLNEISELCGFSDAYAMNKFFRRYNLITPSDFRKTAKKH